MSTRIQNARQKFKSIPLQQVNTLKTNLWSFSLAMPPFFDHQGDAISHQMYSCRAISSCKGDVDGFSDSYPEEKNLKETSYNGSIRSFIREQRVGKLS